MSDSTYPTDNSKHRTVVCPHCSITFIDRSKRHKQKYCSENCWNDFQRQQKNDAKTTYDNAPKLCVSCDKALTLSQFKEGVEHCSCKCANNDKSVVRPKPGPPKQLKQLKFKFGQIFHKRKPGTYSDESYSAFIAGCRKGGKSSANKRQLRSKNEILFAELCQSHFNEVKCNVPMFNGWDADVIVEDVKLAVLWNGPWHYKEMFGNHSLKQVQNRDAIKMREIRKMGYTPYVVEDVSRSYNGAAFVQSEFEKLLSNLASAEVASALTAL